MEESSPSETNKLNEAIKDMLSKYSYENIGKDFPVIIQRCEASIGWGM
jgi:hypothetical protein